MSAQRRRTVEANLFPLSRAAVEPWNKFRWHGAAGERCDTWKEHSSQALAIDVFGALKLASSRDRVLDALAADVGLPAGGSWQVELEWHDAANPLREKQPTRADAVARSPHALIFFECKFSEPDGGSCSQTRPLPTGPRKGQVQCSGHYAWQVNPANGREARCALGAKGIGYWEEIPRVFDYDAASSYAPCPFAGSWFQWMRNITCCSASARAAGLRPAFVVAYAHGDGLPMTARIRQPAWQRFLGRLHPSAITFRALPIQDIVSLACRAAPDDETWPALQAWVDRKISNVAARRMGATMP